MRHSDMIVGKAGRNRRPSIAVPAGRRLPMLDEDTSRLVEACRGMSDEEIIAAHHADYFDENKPHVRQAFEQMGIEEHEVSAWVYRNIK